MQKRKIQSMQANFFYKIFKKQQHSFHYKFKRAFINRFLVKRQIGIPSKFVPNIGKKKTANYFNKRICLFRGVSANDLVYYTFAVQ